MFIFFTSVHCVVVIFLMQSTTYRDLLEMRKHVNVIEVTGPYFNMYSIIILFYIIKTFLKYI